MFCRRQIRHACRDICRTKAGLVRMRYALLNFHPAPIAKMGSGSRGMACSIQQRLISHLVAKSKRCTTKEKRLVPPVSPLILQEKHWINCGALGASMGCGNGTEVMRSAGESNPCRTFGASDAPRIILSLLPARPLIFVSTSGQGVTLGAALPHQLSKNVSAKNNRRVREKHASFLFVAFRTEFRDQLQVCFTVTVGGGT